ncbi:uncharacterized protein LOC127007155 [Eriocheir sinensis]|uniref:uncharacterized protein LOC127007155 n=1 Tax=Eriocheir sinensis TaxID=95602 RepID=UPI0021C7AB2D|nr:uncharacterized protein LOC127007155 [Eriocheir sinensis]XP_050733801.1 uncharacterized protein LOC127007155 [Eriocheir sinensis]
MSDCCRRNIKKKADMGNKRPTAPTTRRPSSPETSPAGPELPSTPRCMHSPRQESTATDNLDHLLPACRLLRTELDSDLTISTLDGSKIKVHRTMLAGQSAYFRCLTSPKWSRKTISLRPGFVDLLNEKKAVEWLVHHMYCGLRHLEDWRQAVDVLHLAHMCFLPMASLLATEVLIHQITNENFPYVFNGAVVNWNKHLTAACEKYLKSRTDEILALEPMVTITRMALETLLWSPALQPSSELLVLAFVVKWGKHSLSRPKGRKLDPTNVSFVGSTTTATTTAITTTITATATSTTTVVTPSTTSAPATSKSPTTPTTPNTPNTTETQTTQSQKKKRKSSYSQSPSHLLPPEPELEFNVALRIEVAGFLPGIRFLTLTAAQILQTVVNYNIFRSSEIIAILLFKMCVPGSNLSRHLSSLDRKSRCMEGTGEGGTKRTEVKKVKTSPVWR